MVAPSGAFLGTWGRICGDNVGLGACAWQPLRDGSCLAELQQAGRHDHPPPSGLSQCRYLHASPHQRVNLSSPHS